MLLNDSKKGPPHLHYRRPYGCAVLSIMDVLQSISEIKEEKDFVLKVYTWVTPRRKRICWVMRYWSSIIRGLYTAFVALSSLQRKLVLLALVFTPLLFQKLVETNEYYHRCFRYVKRFRNYWILPKSVTCKTALLLIWFILNLLSSKPEKYAVFQLMKGIVTHAPAPIPYKSWWPTKEVENNGSQQCVTKKLKTSRHFLSKNLSSLICDFELWTNKFLLSNVVSQS